MRIIHKKSNDDKKSTPYHVIALGPVLVLSGSINILNQKINQDDKK